MAFLNHNGESEFPMSKNRVFDAMCRAIPSIKGMKIENADKLQGRIMVKGGISLFSWGENIPIQLLELSENKTRVQITSSPKTGIMFGGAFDMGKNRKNIEEILSATSRILSSSQSQTPEYENSPSDSFQPNQNFNYAQTQGSSSNAWYDKTWLVILLCIVFFPIGLYALWKNTKIGKGWKIGVTAFFALIVIANMGGKKSSDPKSNEPTTGVSTTTSTNNQTDVRADKATAEKSLVVEKLKAKAKRDWPNDYTTQEFWVRQETEDYEYMLSVEDNPIKRKAQQDWPLDFTTQKFWYNEQIEAKERMK
jgi:hypothetical protein